LLAAAGELLAKLDLVGVVVTGDFALCPARALRERRQKGGDYLLSVKANQRDLQQSIADFFAHAPPAGVEIATASHTDAHADRVEVRTLRASAGLNAYLLGWAGLGQVLRLERQSLAAWTRRTH
jgi:predicted transposase YbfD/YdcC